MTAHDNAQPQTEIGTLLAKIREYREADDAYYVAYEAWANPTNTPHAEAREALRNADKKRMRALQDLQGEWMDTAHKFVALAAHADSLQARIDCALAIPAKPEPLNDFNEWDVAVGWNEARDEFRKQLTAGVDEGEAL